MEMYENLSDFDVLVSTISKVHSQLSAQAGRAVNLSLTLRNWAIGAYIARYELNGADRAAYGDTLIPRLAESLKLAKVRACEKRQLYNYLKFFHAYPEFAQSVSATIQTILPFESLIADEKVRSLTAQFESPVSDLIKCLSYTHLEQIFSIDDPLKRRFYEVECLQSGWSVRELKRQVSSLYYERTSLSHDKERLTKHVGTHAEKSIPVLAIRDPYVFEFLGLDPKEVMYESELENALLEKIQDFLLELGHGFCFEARQKRILIGDTYGFVDLVFYHRILKCHVLLDLKLEGFSHENIGQLNTYVSWYRKNMMLEGDNPPIGMLLCTEKDHALVEYALAGMDNQLFVSKYMLALPDQEEMRRFLEASIRESRGA